jgi:glycosyltransferase involved in cell wall biosynthesis
MRIYTCTPRDFEGGENFLSRDSGLLCRGLGMIGMESRVVMTGKVRAGDGAEVLRAETEDVESADWWRKHGLDGVVLYSWGRAKYRHVAAAINRAGITLILNQDNGGVVSPLNGVEIWLRQQWHQSNQGKGWPAWRMLGVRILRGLTLGLLVTDPLRRRHLAQGKWIACVSPPAADHYRRLCAIYGGEGFREKVTLLPHPVEGRFVYSGENKSERVVCLGRWEDETQKRPRLMMAVVERLLTEERIVVEIIGAVTAGLQRWHDGLGAEMRERVILRGRVERRRLPEIFASAQVFYSPSAYESFGIAAGEALCSGCSVVAARLVSMGSFEWFTEAGCGTLAEEDDVVGHVAALRTELTKWRGGQREPAVISKRWGERLHEREVARQAQLLVEEKADKKR